MIYDVSTHPSVQAAWNAAQSGDTIYFPGGDWNISTVLKDNLRDKIIVRGEGQCSRIIGQTEFQTLFTIAERTGWEFRNLQLVGPGTGRNVTPDSEGCGIQLITAKDCVVSDCLIRNCGMWDHIGVGIACVYLRASCTNCRVEGNIFEDSNCCVNEDAYLVSSVPQGNSAVGNTSRRIRAHYITDNKSSTGLLGIGMRIADNYIDGHHNSDPTFERYGIRVTGCRGSVISGNQIRNCAGGIELYGDATACTIDGSNSIASFVQSTPLLGGYGVWVRSPPGYPQTYPRFCGIKDVNVFGALRDAIFVESGFRISVDGNVLTSPGRDGIRVSASYVSVRNNDVTWPVGHGLYITGPATGNMLVMGNDFLGHLSDTSYLSDAVRIDGEGSPVTVVGNRFANDQPTAGFKYGINRSGGGIVVKEGGNEFLRLQGNVQPGVAKLAW